MPSYVHYPGKASIARAAANASTTCWVLASLAIAGTAGLSLPWKSLYGKILASEYPLALPWAIVSFIVLGVLPGRAVAKTLKSATSDMWTRPGIAEPTAPLPAERAMMIVYRYWTVGLPAVAIAFRYVSR